jgi:hypothetical protein
MSFNWLVTNTPAVVAEVIDGELVVMNLTSGTYYSSQGLGATVWRWIEEGHAVAAIEQALIAGCDVPADTVTRDLTAFIEQLSAESLVRPAPTAPAGELPPPAPPGRLPYDRPTLAVYSDMQDLLLLDPIHDVDAAGWPTLPADADTGKTSR